ncbi:Coactivator CBP, KIX domain-containing protein [Heracleum sosnowskyi]|uniref:Coactivator CBP, KIX domain-containing protein n=1 Tax=Heracleum sosnowskyi TaxID=360622 RepID=A0AAD8MYC0_9APIA|nr:Coactivator CBP, KIX domain-containing protein [Heracleum sosnowskyi]
MPRPGPRPYECVRRAWHSDTHQPIRGSLIQEIFRVVHEIHSPATKNNKEWQEKLPIVVLKAEEIMYSKANSEAEYMDLKTLWDRTNDAINTIIRLDETTETGVFLQPCIEAALHLGCTPRRASRSQRNITPSYYLSPLSYNKMTITSSSLHNSVLGNHGTTNQFKSGYSDPDKTSFSSLHMPSQSSAVCPLFFGDLQPKDSKFNFDTPSRFNVGIPSKLSSHSMNASDIFRKQNPYDKAIASSKPIEADFKDTFGNSHEIGCDLSLRLGCLGSPREIIETRIEKDLRNLSSRTPQGNKLIDSSIQIDKSFFRNSYFCESVDTCSTNWIIEAEKLNLEKTPRKRKAVMDHPCEDEHFCWHPKLPFRNYTGRERNAEP